MLPSQIYFTQLWGAKGAAWATFMTAALTLPVNYAVLLRTTSVPLRALIGNLWRPFLASGAMAVLVRWSIPSEQTPVNMPAQLFALSLAVATGAITYAVVVTLSWLASGKPPGAESIVVQTIASQYHRLRGAKRAK